MVMFVYGIKSDTPINHYAFHYYADYKIVAVSRFTRATYLDSRLQLSSYFWKQAKAIVERPDVVTMMDFEHPWLSGEESELIQNARWFYIPGIP
jgi:hypothetical protein